jgi:hypothetical protein
MVKCGVPSEVRTEFLNIVWMRFCFKRLTLRFAKVQKSDWPGLDYRKSIPAMGWDFTRCHVVTHTLYPEKKVENSPPASDEVKVPRTGFFNRGFAEP